MKHTKTKRRCLALLAVLLAAAGPAAAQAQPTAAAAAEPAQLALRTPVWHPGEKGALRGTAAAGPVLRLSVTDAAGKAVWSGTSRPGQGGAVAAEVPVSAPGYYHLAVAAVSRVPRDGSAGSSVLLRTTFAVVPRPPAARPAADRSLIVGVNTHFAQRDLPPGAVELVRKMGADAVRDELGWGATETQKGTYAFLPRHENYLRALKAANVPVLWSHSYGNPLYNGEGRYPVGPEAAAAYGRFAAEVLKRFGDNVLAVEVLNEPNKLDPVTDYLPTLKALHGAVRGAGFEHEIIGVGGAGPAGGGMAPGFATRLLGAGGAAYCDAFSQHPYMTPFTPDLGYAKGAADLETALTRAGALVRKHGLKGSWITEVGWPALQSDAAPTGEAQKSATGTRAMVSEEKQAAFTARTLLGAARHPHLRGVFIYDFQDDGADPLRREHRFGLVRQDLSPKPGYAAFAVAADFLRGKTFVRRFVTPDSPLAASLYRDARSGDLWAAVWALETTRAALRAGTAPERHMDARNTVRFRVRGGSGGGPTATGYDWQGRALAPAPGPGAAVRTATGLPVYLRVGKGGDAVTIEQVTEAATP